MSMKLTLIISKFLHKEEGQEWTSVCKELIRDPFSKASLLSIPPSTILLMNKSWKYKKYSLKEDKINRKYFDF